MISSRKRPLGVDNVGERLGGVGNHGELARQNVGALLQLILVFEPGVEPFEVRALPQHVGLLGDCHQS